jgi:hypothetical protein
MPGNGSNSVRLRRLPQVCEITGLERSTAQAS